jgi:hypothetical protein
VLRDGVGLLEVDVVCNIRDLTLQSARVR